MQLRTSAFALVLLSLTGCSVTHGLDPLEVESTRTPTPARPVADASTLAACFAGGGALVELGTVDNNDQHDHGALLTFGLSPEGMVAAAGADGTLKFWTLDATLVGVADPGILTYGAELGGAPITDLAFTETLAIAGDVRGLVQQLGADGSGGVVGGTDPDVAIHAVAFDRGAGLLAHAQGGADAPSILPLIVKSLDGERRWNVTDTIPTIRDLAFASDGTLVVGGTDGERALLELRDAADPTRVTARPDVGLDPIVVEIASASEGPELVVATAHTLFAIGGREATPIGTSEEALTSVSLAPDGRIAVTVDATGMLRVWDTAEGVERTHRGIASAFAARIDATGARIVAGGHDALLHVLACQP